VLRRAQDLAERWSSDAGRGWMAWLIFDSAGEPLPAGVRSGPASERRVLFGLGRDSEGEGEAQLDLRIRREAGSADQVEVTGQLLPPRPGASISIRCGKRVRKQRLDRSGAFVIGRLPRDGQATLVVHEAGDGDVELPAVGLDT
jgi:hypothetical protein